MTVRNDFGRRSSAALVLAPCLLAGCTGSARDRPAERAESSTACGAAADSARGRTVDNTLVLTLTEGGGYEVNGRAVEEDDLSRQLAAALARQTGDQRIILIDSVPEARCGDFARLDSLVRASDGTLLDRLGSGWPRQIAPPE